MDLFNSKYLFVAGNSARGTNITVATLGNGECVLAKEDGSVLVGDWSSGDFTSSPKIKVVMKKNGLIYESPLFTASDVKSYVCKGYVAGTNYVAYIGYDAANDTGELEDDATIAANTAYNVYLRRMHIKLAEETDQTQFLYSFGYVTPNTTTVTQKQLAEGLAQQAALQFPRDSELNGFVYTRLVCDVTTAATEGFVGSSTITQDSNTFTTVGRSQVEKITLSGTSGTATVAAAGGLTKTATFASDLATTAANFVTANAAAYLAVGITLTYTSSGASNGVLVFTATVAGTAFTAPTITNATTDLAGSVAHTTANGIAGRYSSGLSTLLVGDYIRVGGAGVAATSKTYGVYKVVAIDSNTANRTITVDRAITEATGTYTGYSGTGDIIVIPKTTIEGASVKFGLAILGQSKYHSVGRFPYDKFNIDIWLDENFVNTSISNTTEATLGTGVGQEVADAEWEAEHERQPGKGEYYMPPRSLSSVLNASDALTYNVTCLMGTTSKGGFLTTHEDKFVIEIATVVGSEQGNYNTAATKPIGVVIGLDKWLYDQTGIDPNQDANLV